VNITIIKGFLRRFYVKTTIIKALLIIFFLLGCSGGDQLPIDRLKEQLKGVPEYSLILEDMKKEGNFFTHYFHKYQIVQADKAWKTDWLEVPEQYYRDNENFLGMTLAANKNGQMSSAPTPPGYNFVGDPKYGQWHQDSSGNSFWEFYGKYRMFTDVLGFLSGPVFRHDYDDYHHYRGRNQYKPYFGRTKQYGTYGNYTKTQKPNFFQRRMKRESIKKSSFSEKVAKRFSGSNKIGRTRSGFRSRSSSFGK